MEKSDRKALVQSLASLHQPFPNPKPKPQIQIPNLSPNPSPSPSHYCPPEIFHPTGDPNFGLQKKDLDLTKKINPENQGFSEDDLEKLRKYIEDLERKNSNSCDVEDNYKSLTKIVLSFFDNTKCILKQDLYGAWLGKGSKEGGENPDRFYIKVMAKIDHVRFFFLIVVGIGGIESQDWVGGQMQWAD